MFLDYDVEKGIRFTKEKTLPIWGFGTSKREGSFNELQPVPGRSYQ